MLPQVRATRAGAVLVPPGFPEVPGRLLLRVENPRLAFLRVAELFVERPGCDGIHPDASIHSDAALGEIGSHIYTSDNSFGAIYISRAGSSGGTISALSLNQIPEPSVVALFGLGGLAIGLRRRRA